MERDEIVKRPTGSNEDERGSHVYAEQFAYFLLAYETRSYATAARRAFLTPQGLAKAIHTFECELGCKLFVESRSGLIPTPCAEEVRRFATGFNAELERLKSTIVHLQGSKSRIIRIGVSLGIMGALGLDFFACFEDAHPSTVIRYEEVSDISCDDGLLENRYDLAFTISSYNQAFETRDLGSMAVFTWVNAHDSLSCRDRILVKDLAGRVIAMPGTDSKNFNRLQSMCREQGVTPTRFLPSHQIHLIFDFVREAKGIGVNVNALLNDPILQSEDVVSLPFEGFNYRYGLSWMKGRALGDIEQEFVDYAVEQQGRESSG